MHFISPGLTFIYTGLTYGLVAVIGAGIVVAFVAWGVRRWVNVKGEKHR